MRKYNTLLAFVLFISLTISFSASAQKINPDLIRKGHWLSEEEYLNRNNYQRSFVETAPPTGSVRNIAEFEKMEGALIAYDGDFGIPFSAIKELAEDATLYTIVASQSQQNQVISLYTSNGVNLEHCKFIRSSVDSWWTRDYGPWFVTYAGDSIGIIDFPYNRPRPNDDEIPKKVADSLNLRWFGMNITHTGGNYMTTGGGSSASTDLVLEENTGQTQEEINAKVLSYLGVSDYALLPDPLADYIKHIDCWGKYLAPDKVLIGQVPQSDPRYEDYEYVANWFATHLSPYGTTFRVYRVYSPGDPLTTPYTNSLILNNKVFVPIGGNEWDDEALTTYQQAMPGYEIHGFTGSWYNTDALHCRVMGLADRGLLYINHIPISGTQNYQNQFQVSASIKAYSHESLYADSLQIFYKIDNGDWQSVVMTESFSNSYTASIPVPCSGGEVKYYLHAADQSGRCAFLPFIGEPDPFVFEVLPGGNSQVSVTQTSINLAVNPGETVSTDINIGNTGNCDLLYSVTASDPWLEIPVLSGSIPSGFQQSVTITANATNLNPGNYESTLTISTNDTINPLVEIPVYLIVTDASDLAVYPDSLIFLNFDTAYFYGLNFVVKNPTSQPVVIQTLDWEGWFWRIDATPLSFPYTLSANDSLILNVKVTIVTDHRGNILYDTLNIENSPYRHQVIIGVDEDFINGVIFNNNHLQMLEKIYPNPFGNQTILTMNNAGNEAIGIEIYNFSGQRVRTLFSGILPQGRQNLVWNGTDDQGRDLPSGCYFVKLITAKSAESHKVMLYR